MAEKRKYDNNERTGERNSEKKQNRMTNRSGSIAWKLNLANQWKRLGNLMFTAVFVFSFPVVKEHHQLQSLNKQTIIINILK